MHIIFGQIFCKQLHTNTHARTAHWLIAVCVCVCARVSSFCHIELWMKKLTTTTKSCLHISREIKREIERELLNSMNKKTPYIQWNVESYLNHSVIYLFFSYIPIRTWFSSFLFLFWIEIKSKSPLKFEDALSVLFLRVDARHLNKQIYYTFNANNDFVLFYFIFFTVKSQQCRL